MGEDEGIWDEDPIVDSMELGSHDRTYWVGQLIEQGIWTEDRMPPDTPVQEWEYNSQMDWWYRPDYAEQLEVGHIEGVDMPWELIPA